MHAPQRSLIEGQPVLVVIDIQGGEPADGETGSMPFMPGYQDAMDRAPELVAKARACGVPIVFFQEAHRRDLVDFGRELDGAEGIHLLEGDPGTDVSPAVGMRPDDYFCRVVEDCVAGSSVDAHDAALAAMEYLQTGARRSSAEVMSAFEVFAGVSA